MLKFRHSLISVFLLLSSSQGFTLLPPAASPLILPKTLLNCAPPPTSAPSPTVSDVAIPTNLPSAKNMDYVPLATMLATGQLAEADQFTRDALIELAGSREAGRTFVYFTEVKNIPETDLATIERLWLKFSGGKFGYSVQRKIWLRQKEDFEKFCRKIGWSTMDGEVERKLKWFGASEFIYDVGKAPEGHLPLTSALRGTALFKNLMTHPLWEGEDWREEPE
mmetsp:Transcript_16092/g.32825  ORF Transcript_16092/g.32825 Transcript_16092/m.32825 type:complete len:222 (+) Transcript_16092:124-789(+)